MFWLQIFECVYEWEWVSMGTKEKKPLGKFTFLGWPEKGLGMDQSKLLMNIMNIIKDEFQLVMARKKYT